MIYVRRQSMPVRHALCNHYFPMKCPDLVSIGIGTKYLEEAVTAAITGNKLLRRPLAAADPALKLERTDLRGVTRRERQQLAASEQHCRLFGANSIGVRKLSRIRGQEGLGAPARL